MARVKIRKCECGYYHIYKRVWYAPWKWRPIKYLYRELFCEAWVNRSFIHESDAEYYIANHRYDESVQDMGEYVSGKNENICQE